MTLPSYLDLTQPWEQRADNGLMLRGRRAPGRGPTLHFLSGNGFCGGVYWPFLRTFLPEFGLFVHDFEGQGRSDAPAHYSGAAAVLRRVRDVAEAQRLTAAPMIGMGHSFGAALTLRLAAQNPGLFKALVLLDPIMFPPPLWAGMRLAGAIGRHPLALATRKRRTRWASRADVIERLAGRGIFKGWTAEALACFADHATHDEGAERVLSCPAELEAQIYERPIYPWADLRKIDIPVLFLYGAQSYPFFPASARYARWTRRHVDVQTLPGGHCFMQEDPAAAHAAVGKFLARRP